MPAHLRRLVRQCRDCGARAEVELFNTRNVSFGEFCRPCGNRRLKGLLRDEHLQAQEEKNP